MLALKLLVLLGLCILPGEIVAADSLWFTIALPDGWKTADADDRVDVLDQAGKRRFGISVNKKNNNFIMCFCSAWRNYEKFERNGFRGARLDQMGVLTVKVSGAKFSTDVHYTYLNNDEDLVNVSAIESIRPK